MTLEVAKGAFQAAQRAVRLSPQPGLRSEVRWEGAPGGGDLRGEVMEI